MMISNVLRALIMAAVFGIAILLAGGVLTRLGRSAGAAVKTAV